MTFSTPAERRAYARGLNNLAGKLWQDARSEDSRPWSGNEIGTARQIGMHDAYRASAREAARRARAVERGGKAK